MVATRCGKDKSQRGDLVLAHPAGQAMIDPNRTPRPKGIAGTHDMARKIDPIQPTNDTARDLARRLLEAARTAALAVIEPGRGAPFVSRIAFGLGADGAPMTLVSELAEHTRALRQDPRVSLLIGEPGTRGDPLIHPRLSLRATAQVLYPDAGDRASLRACWLAGHPKAALYVDFPDFRFVRFDVESALLNAGFGKAYALGINDLKLNKGLE